MQPSSSAIPLPPVAILAGGLATRLRPITEKIPKSLVEVAGRPFLAHQLSQLRAQGITRAVLCVGYLGEMIRDQFGDGSECGVALDYSFDGSAPLGTGGALQKALPLLGQSFFVLYGDSYLPVEYRPVAEAFARSGKAGLMTVFRNEDQWDMSNVCFEDEDIRVYSKKSRTPEMRHIDYGLGMLTPGVFDAFPPGAYLDLADVLSRLVGLRQLAGFEVFERFYEIGSPSGLHEMEALLSGNQRTTNNPLKIP